MWKHDATEQAAELQKLAARLKAIQEAEQRLSRDLQVCIESTNRLLERIIQEEHDHADGSP